MVLPLICSGLRRKLLEHEPVRERERLAAEPRAPRRLAAAVLATWALVLAAPGLAKDDGSPDLLPPERAFALSARGLDARTIEVRFNIAPGYYLYRDKLRFEVESARLDAAPVLPRGAVKEDAFFGRSETYRGELVVRLPLSATASARDVPLIADSQGCADVGVCYPAQRQRIVVPVPALGAPPGPVVEAAPAKRRWFE